MLNVKQLIYNILVKSTITSISLTSYSFNPIFYQTIALNFFIMSSILTTSHFMEWKVLGLVTFVHGNKTIFVHVRRWHCVSNHDTMTTRLLADDTSFKMSPYIGVTIEASLFEFIFKHTQNYQASFR